MDANIIKLKAENVHCELIFILKFQNKYTVLDK